MKNHANITLILSMLFLLVAGAFTLAPETNNLQPNTTVEEIANPGPELNLPSLPELEEVASSCYTCTFGSSGAPDGCKSAAFCGLDTCTGSCDQTGGTLCGECVECEDPTVPCEA